MFSKGKYDCKLLMQTKMGSPVAILQSNDMIMNSRCGRPSMGSRQLSLLPMMRQWHIAEAVLSTLTEGR